MSTEQNKRIALGLLEDLSNAEYDKVLSWLGEDATWWGASDTPPFTGTKTKQQLLERFDSTLRLLFPNGHKITVDHAIAEGDYVAVEGHSYAELAKGKIYENKYHWKLEIRDGKIQAIREYMDSLYAKGMLFG